MIIKLKDVIDDIIYDEKVSKQWTKELFIKIMIRMGYKDGTVRTKKISTESKKE